MGDALSKEIKKAKKKAILDISDRQLEEIPPALGKCTKLVELNVSNNSCTSLHPPLSPSPSLFVPKIGTNNDNNCLFCNKKAHTLPLPNTSPLHTPPNPFQPPFLHITLPSLSISSHPLPTPCLHLLPPYPYKPFPPVVPLKKKTKAKNHHTSR